MPLSLVEKGLATASPVKRWKDANPELVGTERDIVKMLVEELREALGGMKSVVVGNGVGLLLVKKAA